jgi:hypothetical protein
MDVDFERVAELAKLAASDGSVLGALQDDPARIRKPLQLSEAQVRALISAGAFSSARPAKTTSEPQSANADSAELLQFGTLGTLGTLLPPEGSGAFPAPGELPPVPTAPTPPQATTPSTVTPRPVPQAHVPRTAPAVAPRPATPRSAVTPRAAFPGSTPRAGTPTTVGSVTLNTGLASSPGNSRHASASPGALRQTRIPGGIPVAGRIAAQPADGCSCDAALLAIVAQVSATAHATLTALTAIASLD